MHDNSTICDVILFPKTVEADIDYPTERNEEVTEIHRLATD